MSVGSEGSGVYAAKIIAGNCLVITDCRQNPEQTYRFKVIRSRLVDVEQKAHLSGMGR